MTLTCASCKERLADLASRRTQAASVYDVGNVAHDRMGHAMYFTPTGRVALCNAELLPNGDAG